jgi:separase
MMEFLQPVATKWNWHGYVKEVPAVELVKCYHGNSKLFIYCGHGAGEIMCEPYSLRDISCPSSFLWGCSSGRLLCFGIHDPFGPVLSYLSSDSPFVVGNLWDVTDKDIDRLSIACMKTAFGESGCMRDNEFRTENVFTKGNYNGSVHSSVALDVGLCLSNSRNACKLRYIVGSAAIIYGIPCTIDFS